MLLCRFLSPVVVTRSKGEGMLDNTQVSLREEWYDTIVRKSTIRSLATQYTIGQLTDMFKKISGRDTKQKNPLKLARLLKDSYVRRYSNSDLGVLINNIQCYDHVHMVTFQRREILDDIKRYGEYVPNPRFGTELETELPTADELGYFPVWYVNPLILGQSVVDVDAFCLRSFMGCYESAFPMHRYDISNDYYLIEIEVEVGTITENNSSYLCTCLPSIKLLDVVGIYEFYRNDPDCGLPNTELEPYVKVVETFRDSAMCLSDYAAAIEYKTYTGTDKDFSI